jgi:hypothetical protein
MVCFLLTGSFGKGILPEESLMGCKENGAGRMNSGVIAGARIRSCSRLTEKYSLQHAAGIFKRPAFPVLLCLVAFSTAAQTSWAWFDETHIAVAQAAGYRKCYAAAAPDIAKVNLRNAAARNAGVKDIEENNHYFDNVGNREVTAALVLEQAAKYNTAGDVEGHLYGAIIAALRDYRKQRETGYAEEFMAFAAHYIGDLSQPFHNTASDKAVHIANDGVVEAGVLGNIRKIRDCMYEITLTRTNFENDLARETARIANISRALAARVRLRKDQIMTEDEAYAQLGHSASLLRAVLNVLDADNVGPCPVCALSGEPGGRAAANPETVSAPVHEPSLTPVYRIPLRVHLDKSGRNPSDFREIFDEINEIWLTQAGICFEIEATNNGKTSDNGMDLWFLPALPVSPLTNGYYRSDHEIQVRDTPNLKPAAHPARHPAARTAAHELGHGLGLLHRQDSDDNLMRSMTFGWKLNSGEALAARNEAAKKALPDTGPDRCGPPRVP